MVLLTVTAALLVPAEALIVSAEALMVSADALLVSTDGFLLIHTVLADFFMVPTGLLYIFSFGQFWFLLVK